MEETLVNNEINNFNTALLAEYILVTIHSILYRTIKDAIILNFYIS